LDHFEPDDLSVMIAYVSHTYQDIFNNPMQAFLPHSVYPSGKWSLWAEVDPIHFRTELYKAENISALRKEVFEDPLWETEMDGAALLRAMVNRTAVASIVQLPQSVILAAFESLGIELSVDRALVRIAEELLIEHEHLLARAIRKYSVQSGLPIPASAHP